MKETLGEPKQMEQRDMVGDSGKKRNEPLLKNPTYSSCFNFPPPYSKIK